TRPHRYCFPTRRSSDLPGGKAKEASQKPYPLTNQPDPLFYLHHAFIDRIWWQWQSANLSTRLTDIAGYTRQFALPDEELVLATRSEEHTSELQSRENLV